MQHRHMRVICDAVVIDQIHNSIIERRSGKGTRLALVIAIERKCFLTGDGVAQPVIDDSFEALFWLHGSCLHCHGSQYNIVAVVKAGTTASM